MDRFVYPNQNPLIHMPGNISRYGQNLSRALVESRYIIAKYNNMTVESFLGQRSQSCEYRKHELKGYSILVPASPKQQKTAAANLTHERDIPHQPKCLRLPDMAVSKLALEPTNDTCVDFHAYVVPEDPKRLFFKCLILPQGEEHGFNEAHL